MRSPQTILAPALALILAVAPLPARSQRDEDPSDLGVTSLRADLERTRADSSLDEAARSAAVEALETALEQVRAREAFEVRAAASKKERAEGPTELAAVRAELERRRGGTLPEASRAEADLPTKANAEELEARLAATRVQVSDLERELRELETTLASAEARPAENRDRILAVTRSLSEAEVEAAPTSAGEPEASDPLARAERILARSRLAALRSERAALEEEALAFDIHRDLAAAKRELLESDLALLRERVDRLERRKAALVSERIGATEKQIEDLGLPAVAADPEVQVLVEKSRQLVSGNKGLLEQIAAADAELVRARAERERVRRESENLRAQAGLGGLEDSFAEVALELSGSLPTEPATRGEFERRRREIATARLDAFRLEREISAAASVGGEVEGWIDLLRSKGVGEEELNDLRPRLAGFLAHRDQLRSDAVASNRRLASLLGEVDLVAAETLTLADELRDFIGERLVWSASSPPLGRKSFAGFRSTSLSYFGAEAFAEYRRTLAQIDLKQGAVAMILTAVLLLPRRRLRAFLSASAARCRRISIDSIWNTAAALAASLWLALPLPALLGFLGWILVGEAFGSGKAYALGRGLMAPVPLLLVLRFAMVLGWREGVAEAHFRRDRAFLETFRRALLGILLVYLPTHGFLAMSWAEGGALSGFQGPGRILFVGAMILLAVLLRRWFWSEHGLFTQLGNPRGALHRIRRFLLAAAWMLPLALAGLAAMGLFLAAVTLAHLLQKTLLVILGGVLLSAFLNRWASLKARRLALAEALDQREARRKAAAETGEGGGAVGAGESSDAPPRETDALHAGEEARIAAEEDEPADWAVIGEQTRQLIRAVVVMLVLFGCWLAWSQALPVLKFFDNRNLFGEVSVGDLFRLGVIGLLAGFAFQNLPGVLELGFLRALDLDPGLRNTIVTLCQYLVIALAAALAFPVLGLEWARFGWIAAALSVGLGFGLQEVVGNFVCGLILLFERPIRVGDIVSVGGVDGVVSRIRIRATTITNWDKKEFIVPNKEFITGTILNWTLSSPVTRLVFPVGIAYGSRIDRAREILLEIARAQPEVLTDPAPTAVFERFGASTLDLSLRCFVGLPEHRLELTHRVNTLIHERFAREGIEMSFQHHEIHLKSIDPTIRISLGAEAGKGGDREGGA